LETRKNRRIHSESQDRDTPTSILNRQAVQDIVSDPVHLLGAAIFIAAWFVCVASWFAGIVEFILMYALRPSVFRIGRIVLCESLPFTLRRNRFETDRVYPTPKGKFRFINDHELIFSSKFQLFAFKLHTPFPIKGRLNWATVPTRLEGRIPIATALFMLAWLVGWTTGGVMVSLGQAHPPSLLGGIAFTALGWAFAVGMYFVSLPIELRRARAITQEIQAQLASQ
jgi:hypothetical protein